MALVAVVSTAGCGLAGAGGSPGMGSTVDRDQVVIGSYGEVVAMASSQRMIFIASPSGLAVYDRMSQQWLPPLTEADGYPAGRITALAGDPDVEGAWIGTLGEVLFYRPGIDQLIRTVVGTRVDRIIFDRADPAAGAYVGSWESGIGVGNQDLGLGGSARTVTHPGDGWMRVSHTGFASRMQTGDMPPPERWVVAPTLESIAERMPALRSFADLLTRDDALRSWRPSSATQVEGMSEVWLGTQGGGIYRADPLFNRARPLPFGLFEPGASALALASDGVWAASLGAELRGTGGLTFASTDLQQWRWVRGPADGSLAGIPIYDVLVRNGHAWVATDRGVAQRRLSESDGVRSEWGWARFGGRRAYALAVLGGNVWAGMDDGSLAIVGPLNADSTARFDPGAGSTAMPGGTVAGAVRALAAVGDTLWAGSGSGLSMFGPAANGWIDARLVPALPARFQGPIVALATSDTVMLVMTRQRAGIMNLRTRVLSDLPGNPDLSRLGPLISAAVDARTIWIGGDRGAVVIDRAGGLARSVGVAGTMTDRVFDIVLQPEFAWLATATGLVRIRRLPDGGIR